MQNYYAYVLMVAYGQTVNKNNNNNRSLERWIFSMHSINKNNKKGLLYYKVHKKPILAKDEHILCIYINRQSFILLRIKQQYLSSLQTKILNKFTKNALDCFGIFISIFQVLAIAAFVVNIYLSM